MSDTADSQTPVDRRIARSRRQLKKALSELLGERGYDGITVQEICNRADVARSTFYAHFESKEDLLFAGVDQHLMRLVEARPEERSVEEDRRRFRFTLPLLQHVRLQRRFFEATILGGSDARLREVSSGLFTDLVLAELDRLAPHGVGPSVDGVGSRALRVAYARTFVGAFMALLDWWLRSADHLPAEAVDEIFQHFVAPAVEAPYGS